MLTPAVGLPGARRRFWPIDQETVKLSQIERTVPLDLPHCDLLFPYRPRLIGRLALAALR